MTKRRNLVKLIADAATAAGMTFEVVREGGNHSVYSLDGLRFPIARHN